MLNKPTNRTLLYIITRKEKVLAIRCDGAKNTPVIQSNESIFFLSLHLIYILLAYVI